MATKTLYLTATTGDGWRTLSETAQAAVTNADGWVTGTGATLHSEYQVGVERATFSGTTVPDGTLDTTLKDAFRAGPITGDFASGNWVFTFVVRAVTSAGGQNGRVRFRVIKAAADGSSATEITAAQQQGSLVGLMSSTTTDYVSTLTMNPGAIILSNQFLFIQIAWERTVAGSMSTSDVNWRTGSSASLGTRIVTADYTPPPSQAVTGTTIASGLIAQTPSVAYAVIASGQTLADNYAFSISNRTTGLDATYSEGQTFLGNGAILDVITVGLARRDSPAGTGTVKVVLYATTGTSGVDAVPTGTALATSETVDMVAVPFAATVPSGSFRSWPYAFVFVGTNQVTLTNGVTYALAIEMEAGGSGALLGTDEVILGHAGNNVYRSDPDPWAPEPGFDLVFQVWTRTDAQVFAPTVTPAGVGDQAVTTTTLAAGATVTAPIVTPGSITITSTTRASSAATFAPTLTPSVLTPTISSTVTLYVPSVVSTQAITTATIAAVSAISAPTLAAALTAATRGSTATLFAPAVVATQGVTTAAVAAGSMLFAPALAGRLHARGFGYIMTTS